MKLFDRYIGGVVVTGTLVALLVLVGLDIFFNVIDEIDNVGKGSYTLSVMLQSVLLTTCLLYTSDAADDSVYV